MQGVYISASSFLPPVEQLLHLVLQQLWSKMVQKYHTSKRQLMQAVLYMCTRLETGCSGAPVNRLTDCENEITASNCMEAGTTFLSTTFHTNYRKNMPCGSDCNEYQLLI